MQGARDPEEGDVLGKRVDRPRMIGSADVASSPACGPPARRLHFPRVLPCPRPRPGAAPRIRRAVPVIEA